MTKIVDFLNNHYDDNNQLVCKWLTDYVHSSCTYSKYNIDNTQLKVQPAWPDKTVIKYNYFYDDDMKFNHHTNRFMLTFNDNTIYDISIYKFKKFIKRTYKYNLYDRK